MKRRIAITILRIQRLADYQLHRVIELTDDLRILFWQQEIFNSLNCLRILPWIDSQVFLRFKKRYLIEETLKDREILWFNREIQEITRSQMTFIVFIQRSVMYWIALNLINRCDVCAQSIEQLVQE